MSHITLSLLSGMLLTYCVLFYFRMRHTIQGLHGMLVMMQTNFILENMRSKSMLMSLKYSSGWKLGADEHHLT